MVSFTQQGKHRMSRKAKRRATSKYTLDPRYVVTITPRRHESPSAATVTYLFGAMCNQYFTPLRFTGGGERFQCFANVAEQILKFGGSAVLGWSVQRGDTGFVQANKFSKFIVETHCVWRSPTAELLDLTPGYETSDFIADPWGSTANVSFLFLDQKKELCSNAVARAIGFRLPKRPAFEPLPPCFLDGKNFALGIAGRRFSDDQKYQSRVVQTLKALCEDLTCVAA
jgi:hypothetical protein